MFCGQCGNQTPDNYKFCPGCGASLLVAEQPRQVPPTTNYSPPPMQSPPAEEQETEYYRGQGELIVKRTEHRGAGRKLAGLGLGAATFGVGYLVVGKDKTRKSKAEGTIVITNKAIYCAGNDYPFDRILSITKEGRFTKSIVLTFEKEVGAGGRAAGSFAGTGGMSIEMEIKTDDIDGLFRGLENAKMHNIKQK